MSFDLDKIHGLVLEIQSWDVDSFWELYDILLNSIYTFIYYKVSHKETAEDLTEEVFIKVWDSIWKYKTQEKVPFTSWVYRIAWNLVIDYYRKHKNESPWELDFDIIDERALRWVTEGVETAFNQKLIKIGLSKLSQDEQDVIVFKYVNDLWYKEISDILQKGEPAVRKIHSRAIKKLNEILTSYLT